MIKSLAPVLLSLPLFFAPGCAATGADATNEEAVRRILFDLWSQGDFAVIDSHISPTITFSDNANTNSSRDTYRAFVTTYRTAFPDLQFKLEDLIIDGDRAVMRWVNTGTHRGALGDLPATGKKITLRGITIYRMEDGVVAEEWTMWDEAALLRQLGVLQ